MNKNIDKKRHYPKSIFKYCDFSKNTFEVIYSLENLENNIVWLSNPLKFNDPFDCSVGLDANTIVNTIALANIGIIQNTLNDASLNLLSGTIKQRILSSSEPVNELIKNIYSIYGPKSDIANELQKMFDQLYFAGVDDFNTKHKSKLKVSCFSEKNDSLLMWGHYANKHQGFCIEYDLDVPNSCNNEFKKNLYQVHYTDTLIDMTNYLTRHISKIENTVNDKLKQSVLYKFNEWAYEKEWRLVILESEHLSDSFKVSSPKALYLGANVDEENREKLLIIAKKIDIPVYQMGLDKLQYKLNQIIYDS